MAYLMEPLIYINFDTMTPAERYYAMVQSIVPRPIAWVLTDNGNASLNLAPYSFFTGICSDPPLILFSVGKKPIGDEKGVKKDTAINIQERKSFVLHIANRDLLGPLNASAATLNHGDSELEAEGLETVVFDGFSLPRLKACPIAMACTLYRIDEIGNAPQTLVYGEIKSMYLNDNIMDMATKDRLVVQPNKLDPLSRLGGNYYSVLGELLTANRPD